MTGETARKAQQVAWAMGTVLLFSLLVSVSTTPVATINRGKPFVLTEELRTDNGALIPAGTEVLIDGDPSLGVLSVTLHLNATPETVAASFKPITEQRNFLVLSYWVGKP